MTKTETSSFARAIAVVLCAAAHWASPAPSGADQQVSVFTLGDQAAPNVGANADGNFVIVWQSDDGDPPGIFARRFNSSGLQLDPVDLQINSTTSDEQSQPAVLLDDSNGFHVVWSSFGQDGSLGGVFARRFSSAGNPDGGEQQVNTTSTGHQGDPELVNRLPGPESPIVWGSNAGGELDVLGFVPLAELQLPSDTTGAQVHPAIDCLTDPGDPFTAATAMVTWASNGQDGDSYGILARQYHLSPPNLPQFQVNSFTLGAQDHPKIACGPDVTGTAMIVWESSPHQDGSAQGIFGQVIDRMTLLPVGTEFQVNSYTQSQQRFPDISADDSGNFVAVWQSLGQDGAQGGIYGQRYDSTGVALGGEFRVNEYTASDQAAPKVAAMPDGSFVVAWNSAFQDGDFQGVFMRRLWQAGAGSTVSATLGGSPPPTCSVTTPNEGVVSIENRGLFGEYHSGFNFVSVSIEAPAATATDPIILVFEYPVGLSVFFDPEISELLFELFTEVYRNHVKVPDCNGAPGVADPDPCVQSRVIDGEGDLLITVLTSQASQWDFSIGDCPATVDPACVTGFQKGALNIKQDDPTNQKLVAKLLKGPALLQSDLGNPLGLDEGGTGTIIALCIYDDAGDLAGRLYAPRAGDDCGGAPCWSSIGKAPNDPQGPGDGYKYKDAAGDATGLTNLVYKGGAAGKSKAIVKASGANLPAGIAAALAGSNEVTVQLRAVDGECLSATLTDVKVDDGTKFKAK